MKFYINMEWNKIYYAGECNLVDVPTVVNVKCLHQMASNRDITLNEKCWQTPTFRQFLSSSQTTVILMLEGVAGEIFLETPRDRAVSLYCSTLWLQINSVLEVWTGRTPSSNCQTCTR